MSYDVIIAAQYRITPNLWGGMDEFFTVVCRRLAELDVSAVIVVPKLNGTDASHYEEKSIPCVVLDGDNFMDSLIGYCDSHPARILHTHFIPTLSAKYRKFDGSAGAIINTEHMSRPIDGWSFWKKVRTRLSAAVGISYVSDIIHVSKYLEKENIAFFGKALRRKSRVIHNGIKIDSFQKIYHDKYNPGRVLKLVSAGRLVKEKGFSDLIKIVRSIVDQCGQIVELDILGDGPMRTQLENEAGHLLNASVFFRGYVSDIRNRFRAADLYVHTSFQEAFPFVLLEAGESGLPAVAYDVGGNSEIINDGFNGYLVPIGDTEDMLLRIIDYFENPHQLRSQGLFARSRVESEFAIEKMVSNYISCYKKFL